MTKSKKIVIGVASLVILLMAGFIYYREVNKTFTPYQKYCEYYKNNQIDKKSCYDSFKEKCKNTGGNFVENKSCEKPCTNCIFVDSPRGCLATDIKCECSAKYFWNHKKGCITFLDWLSL